MRLRRYRLYTIILDCCQAVGVCCTFSWNLGHAHMPKADHVLQGRTLHGSQSHCTLDPPM